MKLAELFKPRSPFGDARRKLRAAIDAGGIAEDADASAAFQFAFDSLEKVELVMGLEELREEIYLPSATVRELLCRLDRLDREYDSRSEK
jgi:hypothetical protein